MNTQELILGHFERALTPEEENILQQQLSASPEARAMFEQHRNLDVYLNNDAMALGPSSRLDEMTLAAALGVIPEAVAGGSAAAWLSGKVIATVAAVIIGGTSIALLTTSGSKPEAAPAPAAQAPAVHVAPAMPEQTAPQPATATAPAASTARSAAPTVSDRPATKAPAVASSQKARETKTTSKLRIPNSGTVQHGPQIGKNK